MNYEIARGGFDGIANLPMQNLVEPFGCFGIILYLCTLYGT